MHSHTGSAQINNNRMATVTLNVTCGQLYSITAGGTLNDEVIGPAILYELNADNRPCPSVLTTTIEATPSMTGKKNVHNHKVDIIA